MIKHILLLCVLEAAVFCSERSLDFGGLTYRLIHKESKKVLTFVHEGQKLPDGNRATKDGWKLIKGFNQKSIDTKAEWVNAIN